ncbi:unnamed protein product [Callosobruchus maculatus]|uniref:Uncharacterized protein n=1 Tax=Callosobruchus maculatus TaxID=64391 RepID=A0A653DBI4_CALMS|nr:unnamed protein product [Callosobruchus maculatus]
MYPVLAIQTSDASRHQDPLGIWIPCQINPRKLAPNFGCIREEVVEEVVRHLLRCHSNVWTKLSNGLSRASTRAYRRRF